MLIGSIRACTPLDDSAEMSLEARTPRTNVSRICDPTSVWKNSLTREMKDAPPCNNDRGDGCLLESSTRETYTIECAHVAQQV